MVIHMPINMEIFLILSLSDKAIIWLYNGSKKRFLKTTVTRAYQNWLKLKSNMLIWRLIAQPWCPSKGRYNKENWHCLFMYISSLWQNTLWYKIDETDQIMCYFNCPYIETPLIKTSAIDCGVFFCLYSLFVERKCTIYAYTQLFLYHMSVVTNFINFLFYIANLAITCS